MPANPVTINSPIKQPVNIQPNVLVQQKQGTTVSLLQQHNISVVRQAAGHSLLPPTIPCAPSVGATILNTNTVVQSQSIAQNAIKINPWSTSSVEDEGSLTPVPKLTVISNRPPPKVVIQAVSGVNSPIVLNQAPVQTVITNQPAVSVLQTSPVTTNMSDNDSGRLTDTESVVDSSSSSLLLSSQSSSVLSADPTNVGITTITMTNSLMTPGGDAHNVSTTNGQGPLKHKLDESGDHQEVKKLRCDPESSPKLDLSSLTSHLASAFSRQRGSNKVSKPMSEEDCPPVLEPENQGPSNPPDRNIFQHISHIGDAQHMDKVSGFFYE